MAGTYQCQSPCQDQPPEVSCISSITTPPPNQVGTMLLPGPFHVINPSCHLVYFSPVLSLQAQVRPNNLSSPGLLQHNIKFNYYYYVTK
jgi:hypothetical protein